MEYYFKAPIDYPAGLKIESFDATSITFSWKKSKNLEGFIIGYRYRFRCGTKIKIGETFGADSVKVTLTGLIPLMSIFCGLSVAFTSKGGFGPFSPEVSTPLPSIRMYINTCMQQMHLRTIMRIQ